MLGIKGIVMHTVMWTFNMPQKKTRDELRAIIAKSAPNYLNIDGLVRKYFGIAEDRQSIVGIYLWQSKEAADQFYTTAWVETVEERWGAAPTRMGWETPMVVESQEGRLIPA
jgi:hypothetical protein